GDLRNALAAGGELRTASVDGTQNAARQSHHDHDPASRRVGSVGRAGEHAAWRSARRNDAQGSRRDARDREARLVTNAHSTSVPGSAWERTACEALPRGPK